MDNLPGLDRFAAIALQPRPTQRPGLRPIPPLNISPHRLESKRSDNLGAPPSAPKMADEADLRLRLAKLKQHYQPFLQNLTPPLPRHRPRQELREFEFRFEQPEDRVDANRPYNAQGNWELVTIPHYRGPVGRWAAYYRSTFQAQKDLWRDGKIFLVFRGVDYRCQVFLNGIYLGSHEGFFAPFEFDVTSALRAGNNTLLARIENDFPTIGNSWTEEDFDGDKIYAATGPGWDEPGIGWSHCPPGAGIFQPVFLEGRPPVFLSDLWVRPDIDRGEAEAWLEVTLTELAHVTPSLTLEIYPRNFNGQRVTGIEPVIPQAGPGPNLYKIPLKMQGFRLWTLEEPYLYTLRVTLQSGQSTDVREAPFGMRKFHLDEAGSPKGTLYLNNQPIFLRGSNTMGHEQRCVMEGRIDQLVEDVLIYKAAHFNFLRITQRPVQDEVYDVFDALGMLHQCDLPLFGYLRYNQMAEAVRQAGEMERLIRRHPSAILVSLINEPFGIEPGSEKAARMLNRTDLEGFFSAATALIHAHNPDRVVKPVDGDYDPPAPGLPDEHCYCLWYNNHGLPFGKLHEGWLLPLKPGWRGGCGEYGIEGLDDWETMHTCYPQEWIPKSPEDPWQPDRIYGSQTFAMHGKFYDAQETLREWVQASQRHQAWGLRMMTEAFRRRADMMVSTVVHLGIDAWPAGWLKCIVSVDRKPKPAYFAMADALTPLAANLRAARTRLYGGEAIQAEAWVLNDLPEAPPGITLVWWIEWEGKTVFSQRAPAYIRPSGATYQGEINWETPAVEARTPFTLCLALVGIDGQTLHDCQLEFEAFPRIKGSWEGKSAGILGQPGGQAWNFAIHAGLQPLPSLEAGSPDIILADSPEAVEAAGSFLEGFFHSGGKLLCFEQPQETGVWRIAGREICWQAFDPAYYASRKTGHPAVRNLQPFDLSYWYHPGEKRIEPTFHHIVKGNGLRTIAFTTTSIPAGIHLSRPEKYPVAAELQIGAGCVLITQVEALCRFPSEPLAALYLRGLLDYLCH